MSLFSMSGLRNQEYQSHQELLLAFEKSRKRNSITRQDQKLTDPHVVLDLWCVNYWSRIRWSRAFCKEVATFFGLHKQKTYPDQPVFFITLTDISCTTDHDAPWVDQAETSSWAKRSKLCWDGRTWAVRQRVSGDSVVEQEGSVVAFPWDLLGRKPVGDEEAVLPVEPGRVGGSWRGGD
jgi:hypothetical protein